MVNSRQALGPNRVLVTLYSLAALGTTLVPSAVVGVAGVATDVFGVQSADVGGSASFGGVQYDIVRRLSVVVDVATLPPGVTFPGDAVACTLAEGAATAGITLAPVQPSAAEFAAICAGTASTYTGASVLVSATADGLLGNLALGLGGQFGAHLLASGVPAGVIIAKGEAVLEKLAYVVGLIVRLVALIWLAYLVTTWLWARRPALLRERPRSIAWGRA